MPIERIRSDIIASLQVVTDRGLEVHGATGTETTALSQWVSLADTMYEHERQDWWDRDH